MIKFGILMKTYKRKKEDNVALVERSIGSILKQTYQNYVLVTNNKGCARCGT